MAQLSFKNIRKVYDTGEAAVSNFNLQIESGEFVVLVGPSGCGKTTLLRMIAGLEKITDGQILLDGCDMGGLSPKDRDVAMVFQRYSLFPHYNVYKNIALGIKNIESLAKQDVAAKIRKVANALNIGQYLYRKPNTLSGGQRQRVALARAIIREPKVFLLDEPLSNLDAKLRTEMRGEIVRAHEKLKTTFIYVTHDQVEAMSMADRIVVMNEGEIKQVGTPKEIYNFPCNKFVAGFIGTPQMNFFDLTVSVENNRTSIHFLETDIELTKEQASCFVSPFKDRLTITAGIRPEDITFDSCEKEHAPKLPQKAVAGDGFKACPGGDAGHTNASEIKIIGNSNSSIEKPKVSDFDAADVTLALPLRVTMLEELGSETLCYLNFEQNAVQPTESDVDNGHSTIDNSTIEKNYLLMKISKDHSLKRGCKITAYFNMKRMHFFDCETGKRIEINR